MIVVTGAAGFVGSNLLAALEEAGEVDVAICDTFGDNDKWKNVAKREISDIIHPENLFDFLNANADDIKMIYHLGASAYTTEKDTDLVIRNNFTFAREIWRWCAKNDASFLYASSYSTYGAIEDPEDFNDDDSPEALSKLRPLNPYGWSKHLFDRRVARLAISNPEKVPPQWVCLKLFNVYGPNEYHKGWDMSVVSQIAPAMAEGASAKLFKSAHPDYNDGEQMRDFIWVGDVADVMVWFYKNRDKSGIFNVGTGNAATFVDMANALSHAFDKGDAKISFVDLPDGLRDKYQYFTQAKIDKLRAAGYDKPFKTIQDGAREYVERYLSQEDKYR